jgi:adenosylmethionine-8-amino-7-oxononanoate aminotransferase
MSTHSTPPTTSHAALQHRRDIHYGRLPTPQCRPHSRFAGARHRRGSSIWHLLSDADWGTHFGSGSAVACLVHGDLRLRTSIIAQLDRLPYCYSHFFTTAISEELAAALLESTGGSMTKVLFLSSGSEAGLKLSRQYYLELPEPQPNRTLFITRKPSYHDATLSALATGGHVSRRAPFEPLLLGGMGKVSLCSAYRGTREG